MQTIVVIDDEKYIADMVAQALEGEGFRVHVGYDGQMGLQLINAKKPALVVSDVNMPMIHGGKILEYIRRTPAFRQLPIILLSGAPPSTVYPLIDKTSRVAFLKKPLDVVELLSLVKNFLEKYPVIE